MKTITIDDELYTYIASQTKYIGEGASDILRRLLLPESDPSVVQQEAPVATTVAEVEAPSAPQAESNDSNDAIVEQAQELVATQPVDGEQDVFALLTNMNLQQLSSKVELFLSVLSALHLADPTAFSKVLNVKGRNRLYFANSKEQLLEAGSSTNPKQIPASEYWVVTNNNTGKKVSMLKEVTEVLGYSQTDSKRLIAVFAPES